MNSVKPRIVISKCLTFDHCRYDGQIILHPLIEKMKKDIDFIPVCPEMAIHLGVPRQPIRLVMIDEQVQLYQPSTSKNCSESMNSFADKWLKSQNNMDGFLLKSRSPSCGIKDVKVYSSIESKSQVKKEKGFFGNLAKKRYSFLAMEDEGRINNARIREHFLTQIYLQAKFRRLSEAYSVASLIDFHTQNKYLFMAYNQSELQKMGRLVAQAKRLSKEKVLEEYQNHIQAIFCKLPRTASIINSLLHCFGYVSDKLSSDERSYFLDMIQQYKDKHIPLSSLVSIMKAWIVRFKEPYLLGQRLFSPFPEVLIDLTDTGKND